MALPGAPEPDVSTGPTSLGECEVYFRGFLACTRQSLKSKLEATAYVGQLEWARRKVQYSQTDKSCIDKELRTACRSMKLFVNFFFKRLGSEVGVVTYKDYTDMVQAFEQTYNTENSPKAYAVAQSDAGAGFWEAEFRRAYVEERDY